MDKRIDILKGIQPGKLIERDMKKLGFSQRSIAEKTNIPYQTINVLLSGKRNLTTDQALKVEKVLGYEEGFLLILQVFYEIKLTKETEFAKQYPDKPNIRKILFWDIDFDKINWGMYKNAVIKRVLERGNTIEVKEIMRFYRLTEKEMMVYRNQLSHELTL